MKKKILLVLSALFGLMFINSGLNKFFWYMPMPEEMPQGVLDNFAAFAAIGWLMPLVAVVEIIGGFLFIIPKFRALGAIVILPIMVGILTCHAAVDPAGLIIPGILAAINFWVIYENRAKYMPMVKS